MIYNLSDRINIKILPTVQDEDRYIHYVVKENVEGVEYAIYYGRLFIPSNDDVAWIYLNDILEGYKDQDWFRYEDLINYVEYNPAAKMRMNINIYDTESGDTLNEDDIYVDMYHKQRLCDVNNILEVDVENPFDPTDKVPVIFPLISGTYFNGSVHCKLLPTIPSGYDFTQVTSNRYLNEDREIKIRAYDKGGTAYELNSFNIEYSTNYNVAIGCTADEDYYEIIRGFDSLWEYNFDICKVCDCSRYYLKWFDRLGGIQMQPFNKIDTHTTEYEYVNKRNQFFENEVIRISQDDKLELNTGWINEELLPYYESMFVSPFIALYDNETKKHYKVILNEKMFKYKTFHNQGRQLFNLQLNVTLSNTETILY